MKWIFVVFFSNLNASSLAIVSIFCLSFMSVVLNLSYDFKALSLRHHFVPTNFRFIAKRKFTLDSGFFLACPRLLRIWH